jgi:hypothetical protein
MKHLSRKLLYKLHHQQKGQALFLTLVLVLVAGLLLVPMAGILATGARSDLPYKTKTDEIYAADAGIQDARWKIKYDHLPANYSEYDYKSSWNSTLPEQINHKTVNVSVGNAWIPQSIDAPTKYQAQIVLNGQPALGRTPKVIVTSGPAGNTTLEIKIQYYPSLGEVFNMGTLGIWLPPGYTYDSDNISSYYSFSHSQNPYAGGQSVTWDCDSYPFAGDASQHIPPFSGVKPKDRPQCATVQVTYRSTLTGAPDAIAWLDTGLDLTYGVYPSPLASCAWDDNTKIFKVSAAAGSTRIDAYTNKNEVRPFGAAVGGDYYAAGNSLIGGNWDPPGWAGFAPDSNVHTDLYNSTTSNVPSGDGSGEGIPIGAKVEAAYLYWTGWMDWHNFNPSEIQSFYDSCGNFTNWTQSSSDGSQKRVPTGDGHSTGTWNKTPPTPATFWDKVDETTPNDADYITGATAYGSSYRTFTFPAFSISDQPVSGVTVYFRSKDASGSGVNNIQGYLRVGGYYYSAGPYDPGSTWGTTSATWDNNPKTGQPWTAADINGTSANPLQEFGVYCSDTSPNINLSMVYAQVNVLSYWQINSGQFRGQGGSTADQHILSLSSSLDLSDAASVTLSWKQSSSGLSAGDALYFAISTDGGETWGENQEALHGTISQQTKTVVIPGETGAFMLRFSFSFTGSNKYVYLDDITIKKTVSLKCFDNPPESTAKRLIEKTAKVNKVKLNGTSVTADAYQILYPDQFEQNGYDNYKNTWYYTATADVTNLVQDWAKTGISGIYPNGTGNYVLSHYYAGVTNSYDPNFKSNFSDISSYTGYPLGIPSPHTTNPDVRYSVAHAGWSLIIIYASPETLGHQLYLYDIKTPGHKFFCGWHNNPDFDGVNGPGGTVTGFLVPDPIEGDTDAGHITCFVGEGDAGYTGDSIKANGQNLCQSSDPEHNNIWNSDSLIAGVDIDTKGINWNILKPGDTSVQIDLSTDTDCFTMSYIILSFRSRTSTGGLISYLIH